jgi:hypothetical protein
MSSSVKVIRDEDHAMLCTTGGVAGKSLQNAWAPSAKISKKYVYLNL